MMDTTLLSSWVRRFLLEYLVTERNLARNTQRSYRDTLTLLLPFVAWHAKKKPDRLAVTDLSAEIVRRFLQDLQDTRKCGLATRNQRLAGIHSLAQFIGLHSPEHLEWCGQIRIIPSKRAPRSLITYLEKPEMDALLDAPDKSSEQGHRDHAILLYLYNTGARADEAAQTQIGDVDIAHSEARNHSLVLIRGKGTKLRRCPLWPQTAKELMPLMCGRKREEHVFLNRCARPLTRFGIHTLVERYVQKASMQMPSLAGKRISPHTIRHTTATHLLRAGVDINTIRAWLGHVSLNTTNIYAEVDMEMKARALALCEVSEPTSKRRWKYDPDVMKFLKNL